MRSSHTLRESLSCKLNYNLKALHNPVKEQATENHMSMSMAMTETNLPGIKWRMCCGILIPGSDIRVLR